MKYHDISSLMRKNREQAFLYLYQQLYPKVERCILNMGGQIEDAKDIFQDSLIVFYEKSLDPSAIQIDSVHAYIIGISKKLWLKKSGNKQKMPLTSLEEGIEIPADFYPSQSQQHRLLRFLEVAGQKCVALLKAFYYHQQSLTEIATTFGYSSTRSATVQKYKCIEKVRQAVHTKKEAYEAVVE
jgi:DNA-directed RNA polymerase specialized sigma24 family protein